MRVVTQHTLGDPSVLELTEAARPEPGPGQVLIRTGAIGVNPIDGHVRSGAMPTLGEPPFTVGWDVAGTVEVPGPGVSAFAPGDEVLGMLALPGAGSTYAEYVLASVNEIVRKPAGLTVEQAAGLPMAGLTAWQSLVGLARLRPGQRVLVHRAAGGVGHLAVQIAKARGARVTGTASAGKHGLLRRLGVDRPVDYRTEDFAEAGRFDVVFDLVGGEYGERSARALDPGGVLVSGYPQDTGVTAELVAELGIRHALTFVSPSAPDLARLAALVDEGRLTVHVDQVLPLAEAAKAHELVAAGSATGKLVLVP
ncbi:NADP-dependent oxidoreductase [Streptomyces sp. TRM 70361]|uniref:NADP-dependent oxidoreductase n=1 Tax=Streptomyces sp. TRM 70361 TaxID=3116553 RepID=UPI002E7BCF47|nr:NADP-dependent oxidoreductase [Streptomyces sp. TRM 70361]MEE1942921.1 NADP-dependent oxidoreductase [Streptomyces sp. TRM 70361]